MTSTWTARLLIVLVTLGAVGCGGGGGSEAAAAATGGVSGTLLVPPENRLEVEPNDAADQAQAISSGETIAGGAAEPDPGLALPAFPGVEVEDLYRVSAAGAIRIGLTIAANDPVADDLDLVLMTGAGEVVDASEGVLATEMVETPGGGEFLVGIRAVAGASAYVLSVEPVADLTARTPVVPAGARFVPGEVLVKPKGGGPRRDAAAGRQLAATLAARHGLTSSRVFPQGVALLAAPVGRRTIAGDAAAPKLNTPKGDENALKAFTVDRIRRLRADPDVEYAEPNFVRPLLATPNDAHYDKQWHYELIGLPVAWDVTTGNGGTIVAIVDSGVLSGHPDLAPRLIPGYDFVGDPELAADGDGIDADPEDVAREATGFHGTHVAGTIGAATNNEIGVAGVSWQTRLMPIRVAGAGPPTDADIAQAVRYAAGLPNSSGTLPAERAHVINMSFGGPGASRTLGDAVREARAQGVVLVAAAGNENTPEPLFPASFEEVISVSAVDISSQKAPYSSFGPMIDVAAPGGDTGSDIDGDGFVDGILSTLGDGNGSFFYSFVAGTSMAAPHVSGVVALMRAVNPNLSPADVDQLLAGTHPDTDRRITRDLGRSGRDDVFGHGLIDAAQALIAAEAVPGGSGTVPSGPVLTVSPDSLDFGHLLTTLSVEVANAGIGTLEITEARADVPWLTVTPPSGPAPLRLTARVDRTGLSDGDHAGTITVASNASAGEPTATIPVKMVVGDAPSGDVGTLFVLVLDQATLDTVQQAETSAAEGYTFTTPSVEPGAYVVVAGTDRDDDGLVCEVGDACGVYPDPVTVEDGGAPGVNFVVGNSFLLQPPRPAAGADRGVPLRRLR